MAEWKARRNSRQDRSIFGLSSSILREKRITEPWVRRCAATQGFGVQRLRRKDFLPRFWQNTIHIDCLTIS
jgi:hypothetical protein